MKNIEYLKDAYIPEEILHRDEQIKDIQLPFEDLKNGLTIGRSLLIQGVTGSGKTVTIKNILKKYSGQYLFASGVENTTAFKILIALLNKYHRTESDVLLELIEKLQKDKKVIIIDEVHEVKDLNRLLQNLNTIYRKTNLPIILITNRRMFITKMPEDVKKTLFLIKVLFPSYNANQLYDILDQRLKEGQLEIPKQQIKYICALGAKQGNARLTLRLAYEYITKQESNINRIFNNLNKEEWEEITNSLCVSEQNFLKLLIELTEGNIQKITTTEIQKELGRLTPSRISQIISNLREYGFIKIDRTNLGRKGGIISHISFVNQEVKKVLENILISNEGYVV